MTLRAYTPGDFDLLAMRFLDLAGIVREMAKKTKEMEAQSFPLNDKKAEEWLGQLERWALRADTDLETRLRLARGARRAEE